MVPALLPPLPPVAEQNEPKDEVPPLVASEFQLAPGPALPTVTVTEAVEETSINSIAVPPAPPPCPWFQLGPPPPPPPPPPVTMTLTFVIPDGLFQVPLEVKTCIDARPESSPVRFAPLIAGKVPVKFAAGILVKFVAAPLMMLQLQHQ